jgi:hypothetical protein
LPEYATIEEVGVDLDQPPQLVYMVQHSAPPLSAFQGSVDALRLSKLCWRLGHTVNGCAISYRGFFFLETLIRSPEQSRELVLQHAVAFAGVGFEPLTVEDR